MFGKVIILSLALFAGSSYAQTCLNITGPCVGGQCLDGGSCINDVCCTTDAAQNCDNLLDDNFCTSSVAKCTDPTLKDAMSKQCPKSCKTCPGAAGGIAWIKLVQVEQVIA
uniref:ShKT domain-containing protein n=1 Tax=Panagrolaimus sp. ES5 TaxID=591445 RepID=A0AC34G3A0_9BILA